MLVQLWEERQWCEIYPHMAAAKGHIVPLQIMHEYELNIDKCGLGDHYTPLTIAIMRDHAQAADYLLSINANSDLRLVPRVPWPPDDGESYDDRDEDYYVFPRYPSLTPMQYAAHKCSLDMLRVLIKHGLHTHVRDRGTQDGRTPLLWVLRRSDLKLEAVSELACLIVEYSDASEFDAGGPRLLRMAIKYGASTALVKCLITRGAAAIPTRRFPARIFPLDTAVLKGRSELIQLLIDNGATCSQEAIDKAITCDQDDLVKLLIPRCDSFSLERHALAGDIDMVKKYLAYGAEVNPWTHDGRLLARVAEQGHLEVCKFLIQAGADPDDKPGLEETPLCNAIKNQYRDMVQFLLNHGVKTTVRNGISLIAAIRTGKKELVDLVLAHGACVNTPGFPNETPLLAATKLDAVHFAQILIDCGADVNARTGKYGSALHEAIASKHMEVAELLLKSGADVNKIVDAYGTPLHIAANRKSIEMVRLVLKYGRDLNIDVAVGCYGTPLHVAADHGLIEMMQLLIEHGASVNVSSGFHGCPLYAAIASGSLAAVKFLLENGAAVSLQHEKGYLGAVERAREYWEPAQNVSGRGENRREVFEFLKGYTAGEGDLRPIV